MTQEGKNRHSRRRFLGDMGLGFTGLVLNAMFFENAAHATETRSEPRMPARADHVIWLFMMGGVSHLETFDPKPALNRYAGMRLGAPEIRSVLDQERPIAPEFGLTFNYDTKILPPQVGFHKRGKAGIEVSDWWPHVGDTVDDLAIVRSMYTTTTGHEALFQFHTGRTPRQSPQPSLGSWTSYGLGTLNRNLPTFVVLGLPPVSNQGGPGSHQARYLGPDHDGVRIGVEPDAVLPYRPDCVHPSLETQRREIDFIQQINRLTSVQYPDDPNLTARIQSYEVAFGMQRALPEVVNLQQESAATHALYGLDDAVTRPLAQQCLVARRLVERGVRFVQIYHGGNPNDDSGDWDSHDNIRESHARMCAKTDKPIAGLVKDLKRRGMLDRTLVAWVTEFGRTPNVDIRTPGGPMDDNVRTGRDHHIHGFSIWLAGAGLKKGIVHGATDELGFHAVENRHYVTDLHATILHLLGLDPRTLEFPGQQRLDMDRGRVINDILA